MVLTLEEFRRARDERYWAWMLGPAIGMAVAMGLQLAFGLTGKHSGPLFPPLWLLFEPILVVFYAFYAGVRYAQRMRSLGRATRFDRSRATSPPN
jgi:hypothetical protein